MASQIGLTETEITSLAAACDRDADDLAAELARRPWAIHDLLTDPELVASVLEAETLADAPAPFVLFAVMARVAADDLLASTYVNDWIGPRSRLPVFDVEPVQEFVAAPGRVLFIARLLASMVDPAAAPVPEGGCDPWDLVDWLAAVSEHERVLVLRRVGDLSLYIAGVHADAIGNGVLSQDKAEKVGIALGMNSDEILELCDPGSSTPGLDALELVGARSYQQARRDTAAVPPVVSDIAERIHAARRFLTHLADEFLSPIGPDPLLAS
ncbi:MAG: hypothetical protein R8F63_18160 [Acidimicrobiales bacterium]|nr:hypothetical protein [Acidimicrobiales bacterium]